VREGHALGRGVAHVAEHHGLLCHGRAPRLRNAVEAPVCDRAVVHPRREHGADRAQSCSRCSCGNGRPANSPNLALVVGDDSAPPRHPGRCRGSAPSRPRRSRGFPRSHGAPPRAPHPNTSGRSAGSCPRRAVVARRTGQRLHGRSLSPRFSTVSITPGMQARDPERTETSSGFSPLAKRRPVSRPRVREGGVDRGREIIGVLPAVRVGRSAEPGRQREAGWQWQAEVRHLGRIRALAAEQVAHPSPALSSTVPRTCSPWP